ncbi:MAG: hypothetical protein V7K71_07000 [Nostoc sp.]|uniref:hypothetical protein n=1 Tax=Nostoc sp. TaxID=1180 RepID=UPI002FF7978F
MNTPNYSALLQSFWTPPRTPITENSNSNNHPTEPTDIAEFLGEDLLWQQTIPAKEPNLKNIPNDLSNKLIKALLIIRNHPTLLSPTSSLTSN